MRKIEAFVAYRHTGESEVVLEDMLGRICRALGHTGVDPYCTFFEEKDFQAKQLNSRQIMEHAFRMIDARDMLFVVQASEARSEGMIMEVGYCLAKQKPIVIATHQDIRGTYLPQMADKAFAYESLEELESKIAALNIEAILAKPPGIS